MLLEEQSTSTLADNKIVTSSEVPNGSRTTRSYEFSESGCVLQTLSHDESGQVARRYFTRVE
ncbi:unnamed protein product [Timema podura]|uniref:Uncharacterized protein n=1 Tax=Timema podura TaxID=61482 RepID=A0ABN7PDX4_TIMPD|nr:unnamed protein product [Timema podura]